MTGSSNPTQNASIPHGNDAKTLEAGHPPANHSPLFAPVIDPTLATGVRAAVRALFSKVGQK